METCISSRIQFLDKKNILVEQPSRQKRILRCDFEMCHYKTSKPVSLKIHRKNKHGIILFNCKKCDFEMETTSFTNDRNHECSTITFTCDKCEFAATTLGYLKIHKESKHEGIRYPCDECEFAATTLGYLKRHKENKHEGIRYPCDKCEFAATTPSNLKNHK